MTMIRWFPQLASSPDASSPSWTQFSSESQAINTPPFLLTRAIGPTVPMADERLSRKTPSSPNASTFLLKNFRSAKRRYGKKGFPPLLERANTVASGLGPTTRTLLATWDSTEDVGTEGCLSCHSSNSRVSQTHSNLRELRSAPIDESPTLTRFCRGSIKRLKSAENKVSTAKRDMEQILACAKSESDLCDDVSNFEAELLKAQARLENDTRLALEAQGEMRKILVQFATLLQEEEDHVSIKADLLQRTSSQIKFSCVTLPTKKVEEEDEGEISPSEV